MINNIEEEFNLEYICKINENVSRNESIEWGKLRTRDCRNNRNTIYS